MTLPIKRPVQAPAPTLELTPSPYIGTKPWLDGLLLMHHWMAGYFEVGDAFPDYLFAETLGVHRVIADSWLGGLRKVGRIESYAFTRGHNTEVFAPGFVIKPIVGPRKDVKIKKAELVKYDPWTDRSLDHDLPDAIFADYYIDKYYDVFINEYFFATGHMRMRPGSRLFQPLDLSEHPRHEDTAKAKISDQAPPEKWRGIIDELACA